MPMSEIDEGFLSQFGLHETKTSWQIRTSKRLVSILLASLLVPISTFISIPVANAAVPNTFTWNSGSSSGATMFVPLSSTTAVAGLCANGVKSTTKAILWQFSNGSSATTIPSGFSNTNTGLNTTDFTATFTPNGTQSLGDYYFRCLTGTFAGATNTYSVPQTISVRASVTFDANGGTGTMANQLANVATNLTANSFTRLNYTFAGWSTTTGFAAVAYADSASFPFTANTTLHAQWNTTVTFNANGGIPCSIDRGSCSR